MTNKEILNYLELINDEMVSAKLPKSIKVKVKEARKIFISEESEKMLDKDKKQEIWGENTHSELK